jgi:hypothetical protein
VLNLGSTTSQGFTGRNTLFFFRAYSWDFPILFVSHFIWITAKAENRSMTIKGMVSHNTSLFG